MLKHIQVVERLHPGDFKSARLFELSLAPPIMHRVSVKASRKPLFACKYSHGIIGASISRAEISSSRACSSRLHIGL